MHTMRLIFCLALLIFLRLCSAGDLCPPPEISLHFCKCLHQENGRQNQSNLIENSKTISERITDKLVLVPHTAFTAVKCNESHTISDLEQAIVLNYHRKEIDKLTVYSVPPEQEHTFARLPREWLKNTRVRQLELLDSVLSGDFIWYGNPLEGQEQSLLILTVNNCSLYGTLTYDDLGTVNTKGLEYLSRVEVIDFSRNQLTFISSSAFYKSLANLSSIILSRNSIENLASGAFKHVMNLRSIDLSHNLLKSVMRGIFYGSPRYLETLNLSWNFLKVLPADFFVTLPSLKRVHLENNFLFSMPEKPWSSVFAQLTFINIEGNFINCDCHLLWLIPYLTSSTTTAQSGRTFYGKCSYNKPPTSQGLEYSLNNLKRDSLMCNT